MKPKNLTCLKNSDLTNLLGMKGFLTDNERADLLKQHKKERDGRVRDRIKAVLLRDEGWTWMQIAHALLLSEEALRSHLKDYHHLKKAETRKWGF